MYIISIFLIRLFINNTKNKKDSNNKQCDLSKDKIKIEIFKYLYVLCIMSKNKYNKWMGHHFLQNI
jgi:hypothetical protein